MMIILVHIIYIFFKKLVFPTKIGLVGVIFYFTLFSVFNYFYILKKCHFILLKVIKGGTTLFIKVTVTNSA